MTQSEAAKRLQELILDEQEWKVRKAKAEAEQAELVLDATRKHIKIQLGLPVPKEPS